MWLDVFAGVSRHQTTMASKLNDLGFSSVQFFESQGHESKAAPTASWRFMTIPTRASKLAVVAFRGTDKDDPTDLLDDVDAPLVDWNGQGKVFDGFRDALAEVQSPLLAALQNVNCKLLVTGRSLGAAMATLLASLKTPAALYTIGSPRVGDANFVRSLGINAPSDDAVAADRLIASAEHLIKCAWKSGNVGVRDLADHAPINYVAAQAEDDFRHPEPGPALLAGTAVRDLLFPHRTSPRSDDDDREECQRGQSSWDALKRAPTKEKEDAGLKSPALHERPGAGKICRLEAGGTKEGTI